MDSTFEKIIGTIIIIVLGYLVIKAKDNYKYSNYNDSFKKDVKKWNNNKKSKN